MVIPIQGQYEQQCNAAALEQMGIKKLDKLDDDFTDHFQQWVSSDTIKISYDHSTEDILDKVMHLAVAHTKENKERYKKDNTDLMLMPS